MLVIMQMSLLLNVIDHGQRKTGRENAWHSVIGTTIMLGLLYWGGFFH